MANRPTLFLLPGLLCDAYTYAYQARALADEYDVRVLDFFGLDFFTPAIGHAPPVFSDSVFS